MACQLARHLERMGQPVNADGLGLIATNNQPADVLAITERGIHPTFGGILIGTANSYPKQSHLAAMGTRIAFCMFESSKLPDEWLPILNELDAVIVPGQFCYEVFRNSGVTVPLYVVPLGVGEVYQPRLRPDSDTVTFLAFFDQGARKGGLTALETFIEAFGDDERYRLILKGRSRGVRIEMTNPNIQVIQQDMSEQELYELYLSCDVLINANKGEGFGLIPREFAATGGTALATAWGGTADGIGIWGAPLPYKLVRADWKGHKQYEGMDLGEWAEPDKAGIVPTLRYVADNINAYRQTSYRLAPQVRAMYRWDKYAQDILDIWNKHATATQHSENTRPAPVHLLAA
jgi:glycosyltransferase involved in cell wall biosynthesis